MNKAIHIFMFLMLFSAYAAARNFDDLDSRTKDFIVEQLAKALPDVDIAIIHGRRDESYRSGDAALSVHHQAPMGLMRGRLVAMLKGDTGLGNYEVIYFYVPERVAPGKPLFYPRHYISPPYRPSFSSDDLTRLVLMNRETSILRERILPGYSKRTKQMKEFIEDAQSVDVEELMDKYDLRDVFSNRVYQLIEGCMFQVEYPVPEMPETKSMRMDREMGRFTEAHTLELQKWSKRSLVYLSNREVSEIVFIAYTLDGEDGIKKYAEACAENDQILLPISEPVFETEIGKMLFEAVTQNAGTNAL